MRFLDLPPEQYKIGHYVYLTFDGAGSSRLEVPQARLPDAGPWSRHFGYDLSGYPSPLGPEQPLRPAEPTLFDPVMPVWLDNGVHDYRRVIKGSRNALNGAVDEGDEGRGPALVPQRPALLRRARRLRPHRDRVLGPGAARRRRTSGPPRPS